MTQPHPDSAVAVVGMACRLPGAENIDRFWELVRTGQTAWGPVPEDRLNRKLYYHPRKGTLNKTYSDLAALVSYGPVDRQLCPISERAIASHDAAHVTLCEVAAAACRQAGLDPAALPQANTGVYVGHAAASGVAAELAYATYIAGTAKYLRETVGFEQLGHGLGEEVIQEMIDEVRRDRPRRMPDGAPFFGASLAAGLIARTFALDGPYMSFNAACASSSRALVQAVRALQLGNIDMAIVGGASYFHSDTLVLFSQSHSLSSTGSHPFSAESDGMIVGEGYVVLLVKMLARAVAEGNRILAVIPAVGLSSDGRGRSLWAPRREGQVEAIRRAYSPQVAIDRLQYIEAHATSTSLGDITELVALAEVLDGRLPPGTKIPAGSAKLNVGHTLETAGLVGVLKTILALEHETIPPAIDQRPLNPQIDWENVAIYVPRQEVPWPRKTDGTPRRSGVNAFGIGGLNVHVVVDDFVRPRTTAVPGVALPSQQGATAGLPSSASEGDSPIFAAAAPTPGATAGLPSSASEGDSPVFAPAAPTQKSGQSPDNAIAIIGRGAVMPGAPALEAFWDLLASGRDPKTEAPDGRWDPEAFFRPEADRRRPAPRVHGGYVTGFEYDWRKHKIPPKEIAQASPLQFMILDAVDQAIQRAGYQERPFDRRRVGVVVGTPFGGECAADLAVCLRLPEFQDTLARLLRNKGVAEELIATVAQSYGEVLLKHMPILLDETGSFTASALASRITKSFDLMGPAVAVDAAGASSTAALACCVDLLRSGDGEMMICVGGQQDMTPILYEEWSILGRLPAGEAVSPFDARADGTLPAEGCGAMLLKRLSDARRDRDPISGIIRGLGAAYDPCPAGAARRAIDRALVDAGVSAADVALVETTATGMPELDAAQWRAMAEAYGEPTRRRPILLGTTVGQLGDAGAAAGMASLLKATMEIDSCVMQADPGLHRPAPQLTRHAEVLAVPLTPTAITANQQRTVLAGVHSGGAEEVTYHVCLERSTKVTTGRQGRRPKGATAPMQEPAPVGRWNSCEKNELSHVCNTETQTMQPLPRPTKTTAQANLGGAGRIPHFDATERRRKKMREKARTAHAPPAMAERPVVATAGQAAPVVAPTSSAERAAMPNSPQGTVQIESAPAGLDPKELERFLVNFVVEHTGYPPEIVELEADLEADLGIDSIKKAQLFGELGEYFDVEPSEDLSLDDFPTLRHVLDFLVKAQQSTPPSAPAQPAVRPAATPAPAPAPMPAPPPAMEAASEPTNLDAKELESFLVNFVVEHTGYPPEIVELEADLEADLGIDSIKKAQLFGELGEYFDVQPSEDLSLDDFPTLRHVLDFLAKAQGGVSPGSGAP